MPPKDKLKNTKTGPKVHVRMQVMLSRAFQNGHFPFARRKVLLSGQYKAEMLLAKWRFLVHFSYGNFSLHTVFANIVFRKCASCPGGEHNFMKKVKKIKEKMCQEAAKIRN